MAFHTDFQSIPGLVATATLAAKQYYVVKASTTAGEVKVGATAATDPILGIVQNDPAAGEVALVACGGVALAAAETSVIFGSSVTVSTTGRVKSTDTDGNRVVGIALAASSAAGDIIPVLVSIHDRYKA